MATLKGEVKAFIVQSLACFDTPSQVVELVKKRIWPEHHSAAGRITRPDESKRQGAGAEMGGHVQCHPRTLPE